MKKMIQRMTSKYKAAQEEKRQGEMDEEEIKRFENIESGIASFPAWLRIKVDNLEVAIKSAKGEDFSINGNDWIMEELKDTSDVIKSMKFRLEAYQKARIREVERRLGFKHKKEIKTDAVKTLEELLEEIKSRSKGLYHELDNNLKILERYPKYLPDSNIDGILGNLQETKIQIKSIEELLETYKKGG
ncbi:MAG: hypothetical protein A3J63_00360 [Candidatus Moranbacteria bacterium RIFCSPHIGHO2_02_FULL_40_12b]|nr:MAG: hypothetical protein A3J63_00360 [Candidatus Moranbacteria bacterium RIFCSPHIGHO2_02_FULL_40_12b]OGI23025.1 MAG: hypothetical protein A3E91_03425 [Candidatus Moranbacteria bacterium RIFCSPHIGHO2_12_FULL_40_10]